MLRGETPSDQQARAKYLFLALDRKGSAGRPLRAPDSGGNSGLNLADQGYRAHSLEGSETGAQHGS
jgi:hypothetical protein